MLAHEKIKAELENKLKEEAERMATRLVFKVCSTMIRICWSFSALTAIVYVAT
jgi:hypothetical protein